MLKIDVECLYIFQHKAFKSLCWRRFTEKVALAEKGSDLKIQNFHWANNFPENISSPMQEMKATIYHQSMKISALSNEISDLKMVSNQLIEGLSSLNLSLKKLLQNSKGLLY